MEPMTSGGMNPPSPPAAPTTPVTAPTCSGFATRATKANTAPEPAPAARPLLVTLGSALGLSAVNRRLRQPPSYPPALANWVNLADRDDIVAARPNLHKIVDTGRPSTAQLHSTYTTDNGARPHHAGFYLTKPCCGQSIAQALTQRDTD